MFTLSNSIIESLVSTNVVNLIPQFITRTFPHVQFLFQRLNQVFIVSNYFSLQHSAQRSLTFLILKPWGPILTPSDPEQIFAFRLLFLYRLYACRHN